MENNTNNAQRDRGRKKIRKQRRVLKRITYTKCVCVRGSVDGKINGICSLVEWKCMSVCTHKKSFAQRARIASSQAAAAHRYVSKSYPVQQHRQRTTCVRQKEKHMSVGMNVFFIVFKWQRKTVFWAKFMESRVKCRGVMSERASEKSHSKENSFNKIKTVTGIHTYSWRKVCYKHRFSMKAREWKGSTREPGKECCCEQHNVNGEFKQHGVCVARCICWVCTIKLLPNST